MVEKERNDFIAQKREEESTARYLCLLTLSFVFLAFRLSFVCLLYEYDCNCNEIL